MIGSTLVSLKQVEGRLENVRQLVVPRGAVVTPSVRDLLREKKIALTFSTAKVGEQKSAQGDGIRLSLMATLVKPSLKFDLTGPGTGIAKRRNRRRRINIQVSDRDHGSIRRVG